MQSAALLSCVSSGRDEAALDTSVAAASDMSFDVPSTSDDSVDASGIDLLTPNDLVRPDYDLAWSACLGTKLAGTCAEKFFEPFVACFHPQGHCGDYLHNFGEVECRDSGAKRTQYHATTSYTFDNVECLTKSNLIDSTTLFCAGGDTSCHPEPTDGGGIVRPPTGALYEANTEIFTCPMEPRQSSAPTWATAPS